MTSKQIAEFDKIKILADTIAKAINPKQIYLFGSFARGEQTKSSDYDFYVVTDTENNIETQYETTMLALWDKRERPIDVLIGGTERFQKYKNWNSSVERNVFDEGVLLYDNKWFGCCLGNGYCNTSLYR